MEKERKWRVFI